MRQLQRDFEVETRYGGGFVQEIDGVGGGRRSGRPVDWFFYVNGIEADSGAAARQLAARRPRVVGPPRLGRRDARPGGRRLVPRAVRVRLGGQADPGADRLLRRTPSASAARCASGSRRRARRSAASGRSAPAPGRACCACWSARWSEVRIDPTARRLEKGPKVSGVFARPVGEGDRFELLDPRGERVRTLGAGAGLVAATRYPRPAADVGRDGDRRRRGRRRRRPRWSRTRLKDHFAVALENGREVPLPLPAGGAMMP